MSTTPEAHYVLQLHPRAILSGYLPVQSSSFSSPSSSSSPSWPSNSSSCSAAPPCSEEEETRLEAALGTGRPRRDTELPPERDRDTAPRLRATGRRPPPLATGCRQRPWLVRPPLVTGCRRRPWLARRAAGLRGLIGSTTGCHMMNFNENILQFQWWHWHHHRHLHWHLQQQQQQCW